MKRIKNKNVAIIEDDPDIAELMKFILESEGFQVKVFSDGRLIWNKIKELNPCLVITDLWIPGTDGALLTQKLKSEKFTNQIPIIIVSARNSLEQVAKKTKADGFLPKPFNIKDLVTIAKKFTK